MRLFIVKYESEYNQLLSFEIMAHSMEEAWNIVDTEYSYLDVDYIVESGRMYCEA